MKRWPRKFLKLLLFVLAGAIINIAVAWGFLHFLEQSDRALHDATATRWLNSVHLRNGVMNSRCTSASSAAAHLVCISGGSQTVGGLNRVNAVVAGWPMLCVEGEELLSEEWAGSAFRLTPISSRGACHLANLNIGADATTVHFLPYRPLWPGFAINTIFYAAALWLLFAAPFKIRNWRRIKRGQCASCGYSLRGRGSSAGICPECGNTARSPGVELP